MKALQLHDVSRRLPAFLAAILSIVLFWFCAIPVASATTFNQGHVDLLYVTNEGGNLQLQMKEDITGSAVIRPGDDVVLEVIEDAYTTDTTAIPEINQPSYFLPQTQQQNLLWPGWDTQPSGRPIRFEFNAITGPGQVFVFQSETFGGFSAVTDNGSFQLATGSTITQANPAHRHVNWAFTQPGQYAMTVTAVDTATGASSNQVTYTWTVGNAASSPNAEQPNHQPAAPEASNNATNDAAPQPTSEAHVARLRPVIKDDTVTPAQWIDAKSAHFNIGDAGKKDLPQNIGSIPAGPVWMIGSVQEQGVPWLGANTQHPSMLEHLDGGVTWTLTGFEGPGDMVVYSQGNLGTIVGEIWFQTNNQQPSGSHTIASNTHVHPSWVFSQPGTYKVTIEQRGKLKNGQEVAGTATLTFHVGNATQSNAYSEGHFDLGAEITFGPGSNSNGSQPSTTQPPAAANNNGNGNGSHASMQKANAELAATGINMMNISVAILGVGLFVLGIGMARIALAQRNN